MLQVTPFGNIGLHGFVVSPRTQEQVKRFRPASGAEVTFGSAASELINRHLEWYTPNLAGAVASGAQGPVPVGRRDLHLPDRLAHHLALTGPTQGRLTMWGPGNDSPCLRTRAIQSWPYR